MTDGDFGEPPISFRAVLVGDSGVGKSSLIHFLIKGAVAPVQNATVGAVFHTITREVEGRRVQLQIWDTAGQEKYRSIGPVYYRNAAAAIAVYDVSIDDFSTGLDNWILNVKRSTSSASLFIVGNKFDLVTDDDKLALERGKEFADRYHAPFIHTSAKTGFNVEQLFQNVFDQLLAEAKEDPGTFVIEEPKPLPPEESLKCC
jgi:Ras-related protein Rab-5C